MIRVYKITVLLLVLENILYQNSQLAFVHASHPPNTLQSPPPLDSINPRRISASTSFGDTAWAVFDPETYLPCMKLQGRIQFKVVTNDLNNLHKSEWIQVPETAMATGHCQSLWRDYQDIRLSWNEYEQINIFGTDEDPSSNLQHISYSSFSIYFGFATSWQSEFSDLIISPNEFALNSVTIMVEKDGSDKNQNHPVSYSVSDFVAFTTPLNKTFSCSTVKFRTGDLEMIISDFRFQAFNLNETDFNQIFECEADQLNSDKTLVEHIVHGMGWIFISFFALCLFGVILVLLVGGFNKRHDIMAIGYKFVGTNGNQPPES